MINKELFALSAAGMHTLYDSDSYTVVHLESDPQLDADEQLRMQGRDHLALARHGFEIVDKRFGRHVYLDGSWAELFQQQISAWQDNTPTQEEVEDTLEHYAGLAHQTMNLH